MAYTSDEVRSAADRATRQAIEDLRNKAFEAKYELTIKNQLNSSRRVILADITVYEGFKGVCHAAARRVLEMGGSPDDLAAVLEGKGRVARDVYRSIADQAPAFGSNVFADQHWSKVQTRLKELIADAVADLAIGVVGGMTPTQPTVLIHAPNGNALVNVGNGNTQTVHGSLNAGSGLDVTALLTALQQMRSEISSSSLDEAAKTEATDSIIDMTREVRDPQPDIGRLRRYAGKLVDWSNRASAGAAGGVAAHTIVQLLGGP